ncbi:MAG: DUF2281 domain-containing protein [Bryobacterales bacterium]|nr:DUF2281 domain-containing protein [Bryobacterales bacterium]
MEVSSIEEAVLANLRDLPVDKQREVLDFASFLKSKEHRPSRNLRGLWKGMGVSVSAEDIAEARKEMWSHFPRERFFE